MLSPSISMRLILLVSLTLLPGCDGGDGNTYSDNPLGAQGQEPNCP